MSEPKSAAPVPSGASDVSAFLDRVKAMPATAGSGAGRLVFAMDATMSRQPTWDHALSIQSRMFHETRRAGQLQVQLVYFRGFNECRSSKWVADPDALARLMTQVQCRGGNTQLARVLSHLKAEHPRHKINAMVFVGDAFEENIDHVCRLAGEVSLLGVPLFMFQEGADPRAETAFREISRLTGGAYFRLDANAPRVLAELLGAVAAYATGGRAALEARGGSASLLLKQMKP